MYSPYVSLIKNTFLNTKIIINKFHEIPLLSFSLNKTRIMIIVGLLKPNKKELRI
ncbi:MAG: hypothetical protein RSE91_02400 [Bacilli bacterium]